MQEYDFTLHYLEGKKNTRADALSRREGEEEKKQDNKDVIILPKEIFRQLEIKDKKQCQELLHQEHDLPMAGHPGVKRMIKEITKKYDWPGMEEDVKKYVEGCQECQQNKPDRQKRKAPLNPIPIALSPLERISVDLIGPLPITAHINFLLSCNIGHYGKGNRSRLTLLQRCSTPKITCRNQFIQIPLSSSFFMASRVADNFVPPSPPFLD